MFETVLEWVGWGLHYLWQALVVFVTASFVFDVIHYVLHCFLRSRFRLLRWVGNLHQAHHDFFTDQLAFHQPATLRNLVLHVMPEYSTQMMVCTVLLLVFDWPAVAVVMTFFTTLFVLVLIGRGKDPHHVAFDKLSAAHEAVLVGATYHSLHHLHPNSYFSSYTTLFDRLMGTACQVRGRRVAMTGASGAFGAPFKELLEKSEAAWVKTFKFGDHFTYDDYTRLDDVLREADILVLAHGSKKDQAMAANCDSFVAIIERFRELTRERRFPVEVWAVGSEIECHPAFGDADLQIYLESKRAYARHAWRYYRDRGILYRHIVPSAFTSRMGRGLMSGRLAARWALFLIRRGFRYVPVTYTGVALANWFKFLLARPAAPTPEHLPPRQP